MEIKELEEIVDNTILQHDYPGFEPRSLNLALPQAVNDSPARLYVEALKSKNVYVQLVGLRWFQMRPGAAKNHSQIIATQLDNIDPWVRLEAIRTIEIAKLWEDNSILKVTALLKDAEENVRMEAAKACGCLSKDIKKTPKNQALSLEEHIIAALKEASRDKSESVRRKAIKSLRKLGAYFSEAS